MDCGVCFVDGSGRMFVDGLMSVIKPFDDMMSGDDDNETFFVVGRRVEWEVSSASGMTWSRWSLEGSTASPGRSPFRRQPNSCSGGYRQSRSQEYHWRWRASCLSLTSSITTTLSRTSSSSPFIYSSSSILFPESCCWFCPSQLCGLFLPRRIRRCSGRPFFLTFSMMYSTLSSSTSQFPP